MWLLPVPGLPTIRALAPSPRNFRVCSSKQAARGSLGLKRQSKSAREGFSSRPESLKRRAIRRLWRRRSEEHTSELQSRQYLVCRLLLEKKKKLANTDPSDHRLLAYFADP